MREESKFKVWEVESSSGESHRGAELVTGGLAAGEIKDQNLLIVKRKEKKIRLWYEKNEEP